MNGQKISLLIYYNLVLISRSSDGLQRGLNALKQFCETRQLMVNTNKSKIMHVTKKRRYEQPTVAYNNDLLQSVDNFLFLSFL